jgi:hypothetical protein
MEATMQRSEGMKSVFDGFVRGGVWGAVVGLFAVVVEVAPLILR